MKITFVRHTEVEEKYIGKYNGHIDITLSNNGKKQAKELANRFKDEKFDKVYCSDLLRAKETLEAFNLNVEPIYTKKLREKSWGSDEGKSYDEICKEKNIEYKNFEQWISALDGESIIDYQKRVKSYFVDVLKKDNAKNILVVTHSGFIKILISIIDGCILEDAFNVNLGYGGVMVYEKDSYYISN